MSQDFGPEFLILSRLSSIVLTSTIFSYFLLPDGHRMDSPKGSADARAAGDALQRRLWDSSTTSSTEFSGGEGSYLFFHTHARSCSLENPPSNACGKNPFWGGFIFLINFLYKTMVSSHFGPILTKSQIFLKTISGRARDRARAQARARARGSSTGSGTGFSGGEGSYLCFHTHARSCSLENPPSNACGKNVQL